MSRAKRVKNKMFTCLLYKTRLGSSKYCVQNTANNRSYALYWNRKGFSNKQNKIQEFNVGASFGFMKPPAPFCWTASITFEWSCLVLTHHSLCSFVSLMSSTYDELFSFGWCNVFLFKWDSIQMWICLTAKLKKCSIVYMGYSLFAYSRISV